MARSLLLMVLRLCYTFGRGLLNYSNARVMHVVRTCILWDLLKSTNITCSISQNRKHFCKSKMSDGGLKCKIGPSVLNADLADLYNESKRMLDCGADYLHLDVMDGHFVPNITFGHPVVKCLKTKIPNAFFETHMMVSKPIQWIEPMADAGVDQYTFHIEACEDNVPLVCRKIQEAGMKVGLALKPGTKVDDVVKYIDHADMILIMTVEPGFGGQKFMTPMMEKVKWLRDNYPTLDIEVDGGVGPSTITACAEAGANMIVSGTAVVGATDPKNVISKMRNVVSESLKKHS